MTMYDECIKKHSASSPRCKRICETVITDVQDDSQESMHAIIGRDVVDAAVEGQCGEQVRRIAQSVLANACGPRAFWDGTKCKSCYGGISITNISMAGYATSSAAHRFMEFKFQQQTPLANSDSLKIYSYSNEAFVSSNIGDSTTSGIAARNAKDIYDNKSPLEALDFAFYSAAMVASIVVDLTPDNLDALAFLTVFYSFNPAGVGWETPKSVFNGLSRVNDKYNLDIDIADKKALMTYQSLPPEAQTFPRMFSCDGSGVVVIGGDTFNNDTVSCCRSTQSVFGTIPVSGQCECRDLN